MVVKRGIAVSLPLCAALPSIAVPEPFSIELTGDSNGVTLMARCTQGSIVKQQLAAHYPQAVIHEVPHIKTPPASPGRRTSMVDYHARGRPEVPPTPNLPRPRPV